MRPRTVLVAFLLLLYIGPSIFIVSYASPTTPAEPNMNKDFNIAANWYDESWLYRKNITIDGASGAGINYAVGVDVTYDTDMQADFDDIRFTNDGGVTLLDFWRETYVASTSAEFWVKVSDDLETGALIYIYYGNPDVNTISNGTNTFIFFDDFENNNFNRWTDSTSDAWTIQGGTVKEGTLAAKADYASGDRWINYTFSSPKSSSFLYHADVRLQSISSQYSYLAYASESNTDEVYIGFTSSNDWATFNGSLVYFEENTVAAATWYEQEIAVDFDDTEFQCWINGNAKTTQPLVDATDSAVADIASIRVGPVAAVGFDLWVDNYYIRTWVNDEPVVDSFGDEEPLYPPDWKIINEVELIFSVLVDETGLNLLLIFLGLFMIPTSTLYLVKGGTSELSGNKFFYFCIAFIIGWALFIGGIM